ncbi:hypothetical protein P692DRAFT_201804313 [Suillus brevipes Sb2]|nr:hypothetical protein P692DRAFT_201804313 [Suillus brevipes Sb2]
MSIPSSPSSTRLSLEPARFVADPKIVKMIVSIVTARHGILHYHGQTAELSTFQWPTTRQGHKIHPSKFKAYRNEHTFRYPCCLCGRGGKYVEVSIFQRTRGTCEVNIEKFFGRACVPAMYYPRRGRCPKSNTTKFFNSKSKHTVIVHIQVKI